MKRYIVLLIFWSVTLSLLQAQTTVFINEADYLSTPTSGVGIAGPANTDLSGWQVAMYDNNGAQIGSTYTFPANTKIDDEGAGYGEIWVPMPNSNNNLPSATFVIADALPTVRQALTFSPTGGSITIPPSATGPGAGVTTTGVTTIQLLSTQALQLYGTGTEYEDFTGWTTGTVTSSGDINTTAGQVFSVLPVELIEFNGTNIGDAIQLNWNTATEKNNDYFEIQYSVNGEQFSTVHEIDGAGTTNEIQHYHYIDETPNNGWNYYRLKQVDFDGEFTYSDVLSIYMDEKGDISIYPNPITKGQSLQVNSTYSLETNLRIIDINGRIIKDVILRPSTDLIDISDLPNGIYIYQVLTKDKVLKTDKLVIVE